MEYIVQGSYARIDVKKKSKVEYSHGDKIKPTKEELKRFPEKFKLYIADIDDEKDDEKDDGDDGK